MHKSADVVAGRLRPVTAVVGHMHLNCSEARPYKSQVSGGTCQLVRQSCTMYARCMHDAHYGPMKRCCSAVCKGCRRRAPPLKPVASVSSQQVRSSRTACCSLVVSHSVTENVAMQAPASKQTTADTLQQPAEVVQLYRYPGLSKSAAATLLRKVAPAALPCPAPAAQMAQNFISLL